MTIVQERLASGVPRSWFARLLDALLEPPKRRRRLDPRLLPPYLQRDIGVLDDAAGRDRPDRLRAGW